VALLAGQFIQPLWHHACIFLQEGLSVALQVLKAGAAQLEVIQLLLCCGAVCRKLPELRAKLVKRYVALRRHVLIAGALAVERGYFVEPGQGLRLRVAVHTGAFGVYHLIQART